MRSQRLGCRASRFGLRIARVQLVVVVLLLVAVRSQAALAQSLPPDTTPPTVSITSPAGGAQVTRSVAITATASDTVGVTSVTFRVDGTIIDTDTKSPYSVRWNTREVAAGSHMLRAEARDAAGNVGTSATVTVTVGSATDTTPPTVSITSPAGGAQVTGTVAITATASDTVGVTSVTFRVDGTVIGTDTSSPYSVSWDTSGGAAGSHTLRAEARDAAGNVGTSATVTLTVAPATDTTPPAVSITSPAGGAQVTGAVTLTATASDTVGVTSVTFRVDGTVIGTDASSPYSVSWNTSGVAAGSHTLRAEARDAAGNVGTSAAVTVTVVANQPPSVTMTAPANGSTYQAPATITPAASATDADGSVSRVDFYAGSTLIGADTTSPFSFTWTASAAGTYVLSAKAVDNAGAVTTSASVSVTVTNPPSPRTAVFVPSANDSVVIRYVLDVFPNGADPAISTPSATQDLGKPPVVNGEIAADISQTVASLQPGTYIATVIPGLRCGPPP